MQHGEIRRSPIFIRISQRMVLGAISTAMQKQLWRPESPEKHIVQA
jgi:hypothetical protein